MDNYFNINKYDLLKTLSNNYENSKDQVIEFGIIKLYDCLLIRVINYKHQIYEDTYEYLSVIDFIDNYGLGNIIYSIDINNYIYDIIKDTSNKKYLFLTNKCILTYQYLNEYENNTGNFSLIKSSEYYNLPNDILFQNNRNVKFYLLNNNDYYFIIKSGNYFFLYNNTDINFILGPNNRTYNTVINNIINNIDIKNYFYCNLSFDFENYYYYLLNNTLNKEYYNNSTENIFKPFQVSNLIKILVYNDKIYLVKNNKIYILNKDTGDLLKIIEGNYLVKDIQISLQFLIVLYSNNDIKIYKINDSVDLKFNYKRLEKDINDDYYLNCNVTLYNNKNLHEKVPYKVTLHYRDIDTSYIFPEIPLTKNIYIKLDKKMLYENSFNISNYNVLYSISDINNLFSYNNYYTNNNDDIVSKFIFNDFYIYNNSLYFRLKYLCNNNYNIKLVLDSDTIETNNRIIINNYNTYKIQYNNNNLQYNNKNIIIGGESDRLLNNSLIQPNLKNKMNDENDEIKESILFQRIYNEYDNLSTKYCWFKFNNISTLYDDNGNLKNTFNIYAYILYNDYSSNLSKTFTFSSKDIRIVNNQDILYRTIEDDIKAIERRYMIQDTSIISNENNNIIFSKDEYINNNLYDNNIIKVISNQEINIIDRDYLINDIPNKNGKQIELSVNINDKVMKENNLVTSVFIDGYKILNKDYTQYYNNMGCIRLFIPLNILSSYIDSDDIIDNIDSRIEYPLKDHVIVVQINNKKIVDSENTIISYKVKDTDDLDRIISNGINISSNIIKTNIIETEMKVYIKKNNGMIYKRFNPDFYLININYEYNFLYLKINNAYYIEVGDTIYITTNGINSQDSFYYNLNNIYNDTITSIPLIYLDNNNNIIEYDIDNAEDIDININGLTLYPNRDFDLIKNENSNVPSMILFKHSIPKKYSKIEVNFLNKNNNHVLYLNNTALNYLNNEYIALDNIITLNSDDSYTFNKNKKFEVYNDNLRISPNDINILDSKTIQISNDIELHNIMIRWSIDNHIYTKDILDIYKYIDISDDYKNYYHRVQENIIMNNFDKYCLDTEENLSDKKLMLLEINDNIYNCNIDKFNYDCILDSNIINNKYFKNNIIIDCNKNR